ncbi:MAG TPA: hypothetical protein VGC21_12785 [Telluria sp.]|jgi:hypothetical protein
MAGPYYTRSTTGANANSGLSWTLAELDLGGSGGAAADAAAGEIIWVSQAHAESTTGVVVITLAGTAQNPVKVLCGNDATEPPNALATGATVTATSNITLNGPGYYYGMTFRPGSGGSVTQSFLSGNTGANNTQVLEECSIQLLTTGTGLAKIGIGDDGRADSNTYIYKGTTFKIGGVNHRVKVSGNYFHRGGSFVSGTAIPLNVYESGLRGIGEWLVTGFDFSVNIGSAFNLIIQNVGGHCFTARFHSIKLPAAWSGRPWSAKPLAQGIRAEIWDSLIGTTRLRAWVEEFAGDSRDDVTVYRTGGFVDDVDSVNFSIKMITSANSAYPTVGHKGVPVNFTVSASGSPITKYVEVVHDSQGSGAGGALTDGDMILELAGPSGFTTNVKASFIATATSHATSTETWVGTGGMSAPVKQRLAITFTPPRKGGYTLTPVLYIASKTVYYCMKAT